MTCFVPPFTPLLFLLWATLSLPSMSLSFQEWLFHVCCFTGVSCAIFLYTLSYQFQSLAFAALAQCGTRQDGIKSGRSDRCFTFSPFFFFLSPSPFAYNHLPISRPWLTLSFAFSSLVRVKRCHHTAQCDRHLLTSHCLHNNLFMEATHLKFHHHHQIITSFNSSEEVQRGGAEVG